MAADSDGFISVDSNIDNSHAKGDRLAGIENIIGSAYSDIIYGSDENNRLAGGSGDDWLIGGRAMMCWKVVQDKISCGEMAEIKPAM